MDDAAFKEDKRFFKDVFWHNSSEWENVFSTQQRYGVDISPETFQRYKK
jgi:hypothetical protein